MDLSNWPEKELTPRYNVAPTQRAPVVRVDARGERCGVMLRWGLIPPWADEPSIGSRLINARSESIFVKPAFRKAAAEHRCVVPLSGFYEWQTIKGERAKRPHWIGRANREPLFVAGLWESWEDKNTRRAGPVETFTILTTEPIALLRPLHDRMPAILQAAELSAWLSPATERAGVEKLLRPYGGSDLIAYRVGIGVNATARDDAELIAPAA